MKRQHLLRVDRPAADFAPLIAALGREGRRVGWLELAAPAPLPESLAAAADGGVLRAVGVGGGRSAAVKPIRGEPVLRDLLREHFRGCVLVLVAGAVVAPLLEPSEGSWRLNVPGQAPVRWTTEDLVAALRQPRPWAGALTDG